MFVFLFNFYTQNTNSAFYTKAGCVWLHVLNVRVYSIVWGRVYGAVYSIASIGGQWIMKVAAARKASAPSSPSTTTMRSYVCRPTHRSSSYTTGTGKVWGGGSHVVCGVELCLCQTLWKTKDYLLWEKKKKKSAILTGEPLNLKHVVIWPLYRLASASGNAWKGKW